MLTRRRLGLEEAEALCELSRDEPSQRDVVDEREQPDLLASLLGAGAHGHLDDELERGGIRGLSVEKGGFH